MPLLPGHVSLLPYRQNLYDLSAGRIVAFVPRDSIVLWIVAWPLTGETNRWLVLALGRLGLMYEAS